MFYDLQEQVRVLETIHENMIYDPRLLVSQYPIKEKEWAEISAQIAKGVTD